MQKILLITTIYPLPSKENKGTAVCHYFTREWVKMGYRVRVVHFHSVFPLPFYWLAQMNWKFIAAKTGAVVYTERDKGAIYESEGVEINRIPLFKSMPHRGYSKRVINMAIEKVVEWNKIGDFVPNIIVGHFPNPQIEVVGRLKDIYSGTPTAIVMHGDIEIAQKVYGKRLLSLAEKIDMWGFRNPAVLCSFEKNIMKVNNSFMCYSGIPEDYITPSHNVHSFESATSKFVYVGEMIERKYPVEVMLALEKAYPDGNYQLTYVGEGQLLNTIKEQVASGKIKGQVNILGRIPRDSIKLEYDKADCMVMISRGEAFGLVYLEAMARGCITIASRNEGMDGLIIDGENGFLCRAGGVDELAKILQHINEMTRDEKLQVSQKAIEKAKALTDFKVAKLYIEDMKVLIDKKRVNSQGNTPPSIPRIVQVISTSCTKDESLTPRLAA